MPIDFTADPVPLRYDGDGVIRLPGSRVRLEAIVTAYHTGATPEEITQEFSTVRLVDAYAIVAFYLQRRAQVDAYLAEQAVPAEEVRRKIEAKSGTGEEILERLRARRVASS